MEARKMVAAGLLARGGTQAHVASLLSPPCSVRTLRRWLKEAPFQREIERVRENSTGPSPEGVLLDALSATTDDGVRWDTRVKAAIELRNRPTPGAAGSNGGANAGGGLIHMTVIAYRCESCGKFDLIPPPGLEDAAETIEDAEVEEIPRDDPPPLALGPGIPGVT